MNLLERKSTFDNKVAKYMYDHRPNFTTNETTVMNYDNYCNHTYGSEFKDITYNTSRDYVIINFNHINPKNEQNS